MAGILNEQFLARLGDNLFFTGFIISKSTLVPIALVSLILNIISLTIYAIAYLVWFLSSYASHNNRDYCELPAYKQFKKHVIQYLFSSLTGVVATILSVVAIFFPIIAIPAAALFLVSNLCWVVGEYYRLKLSDKSEHYAIVPKAQQAYFQYAVTATLVSIITLTSVVLCAAFPPLTLVITAVTFIIGGVLGCFALIRWADSKAINLRDSQTESKQSYHQVISQTSKRGNTLGTQTAPPSPEKSQPLFPPSPKPLIKQPIVPTTVEAISLLQ